MKAQSAGSHLSKATNKAMKKLDLSKIVQHEFHAREFVQEVHKKTQIVLHHTASGEGVGGDVNWWLKDKKRIGTCVLVEGNGIIHQVFSSKFWGYHIGETSADFKKIGLPYERHDMMSIGIEIDSWGGLKRHGDVWKSYTGQVVPNENVVEYRDNYRGYYGFERYTDEQIESVRQLLVFWSETYGIPLDYNECMWDLSKKAMGSVPGVYSHTSYRSDKSDIHPQKELIEMLKSLTL